MDSDYDTGGPKDDYRNALFNYTAEDKGPILQYKLTPIIKQLQSLSLRQQRFS
jgi:hypothetical protein